MVAVVFMALAVPAALSMRSQSVVQEVATGATVESAAAASQSTGGTAGNAAAVAQDDDNRDDERESTGDRSVGRFEIRFGDVSFSGQVLTGEAAFSAAADAEAAADETRDVDGQTAWISRDGEQATVSSLIDGSEFVEVTGPGNQLDRLLDIAANGAPSLPPLPHMPGMPAFPQLPEIEQFFEGFEGFNDFEDFDPEAFFERFGDHSGEGFNFHFDFDHDADGERPRFEFNFGEPGDRSRFDLFFEGELGDALSNGDFSELEEFFDDLERDFGDFEQRFENGEFGNHPFFSGENFDGCISIGADGDDGSMSFEFPPGCRADG